jgi:hypothetical protein
VSSRSQTALGLTGIALALAAGAAVVWGRVRSVDVPRRGTWPAVPEICTEAKRREVQGAVRALRDHGYRLDLLPPREGPCPERAGQIVVRVDVALDTAGPMGTGWVGGEITDRDESESVTWGSTRVTQTTDGAIVRAIVRLHPDADELTATHELLHALGWDHPVAPPTGHVMHPHAPSLADWRGVEGP